MAKVKGHAGIAKFSRTCPMCGLLIKAGSRIAKQMVDGEVLWMHEHCWIPGGPSRYTRSLDREFKRLIGGGGGMFMWKAKQHSEIVLSVGRCG